MRVAVLVKQVPRFEEMTLGPDGRLRREGLELEMNPYCRRAVSKGVELARLHGGTCTVATLGPPAAEDVLREAVAWGADEGILLTDPAFAGSDTLATSRALARLLSAEGPFDLVLLGRNSVDADTGQVGPQVAQLAGLPFLTGVRQLELESGTVRARCEYDDGWASCEVPLPAVLSCAERLCEPAKVPPEGRAGVPSARIRRVSADGLGGGPWGQEASPTSVGQVRVLETARSRTVLEGSPAEQVEMAVKLLAESGALGPPGPEAEPAGGDETVPAGWERGSEVIGVLLEEGRSRCSRELLGAGARLASLIGASVTAVGTSAALAEVPAATWGADGLLELARVSTEEDVAGLVGDWCERSAPWAVLAPGTVYGREVASRTAARLGAGLTGDAVELTVDRGRLVAWKPAFGGRLVAAIRAGSPVQMATVRPGMLPLLAPRSAGTPASERVEGRPSGRVVTTGRGRDDDVEILGTAETVVGVGTGVDPSEYGLLEGLLSVLGAELGATRKVTDRGWQPKSRQVGITGRSISPRLYVAIALSGKFNHMIGVRGAGKVLAVNSQPDAPVFDAADIGVVADWHEVVPLMVEAIGAAGLAPA